MRKHELIIIGAGPSGMAAAAAAHECGIRDIVMIDREEAPGGILRQCVHQGFGQKRFGTELTGPEYAAAFEKKIKEYGIDLHSRSMVMSLSRDRVIEFQSPEGYFTLSADAIILATGCRERNRGAINIPGTRPAGICTAGIAQKLVNCKHYSIGKNIVILGSGDIGLIMARRLTLEGAKVEAVCEIMPYSSGLKKNIRDCLERFDIPLLLGHTVTETFGRDRLCGVTVSEVDSERNPIPGTEKYIECDTLLLSVGLIPENELTVDAGIPIDPVTKGPIVDQFRQTLVPGIFACGNVLQVHDLVDNVSDESELAGRFAAEYIKGGFASDQKCVPSSAEDGVSYVLPQRIYTDDERDVTLYFRVRRPMENVRISVTSNGKEIISLHRDRVSPGEMEKLILTGENISDISGAVSVSVKPEE